MSFHLFRHRLASFQLHDATLTTTNTNTNMTTTTSTAPLGVGDSIRLGFSHSTMQTVSFWARCYRVNNDGTVSVKIPDKAFKLQFCPYPTQYRKYKNEFPVVSIKRA